ncbi:MAG: diacylglycerol kinase family protein [Chitinophagales bacterium]
MTEEDFKKKKSIVQKFAYAFRGMFIPYKTEISIRIQTGFALAAAALGVFLHISRTDWLWIIVAAALVLITETLNTAIEKLVDLVSPGYNELAGKVKDIAAGAVFMAALIAVLIGLLVFLPHL